MNYFTNCRAKLDGEYDFCAMCGKPVSLKSKRDGFTDDKGLLKNESISEVLFCTIDEKKHCSKVDDLTLTEFLKRRSEILVGFTPENRIAYDMKTEEFKNQMK